MKQPTSIFHCWECQNRQYNYTLSYFYIGSNNKWTHEFMCHKSLLEWRAVFQPFIEHITIGGKGYE